MPPLRERREDIQELAVNYVSYLRPRIGCDVHGLTDEALAALRDYSWPGNVRELINVVERAMLLCAGDEITLAELPVTVSGSDPAVASLAGAVTTGPVRLPAEWLRRPWREVRRVFLGQLERAYLEGLLEQTGGCIGDTARQAGMEPRSLFEKMRRHRLRKEDFRV